MSATRALVAICPHRPDLAGQPLLGHVAWGYEYPDGTWLIGTLEGAGWQGSFNGWWAKRVPSLESALHYFANLKKIAEYDAYKLLHVSEGIQPDFRQADRVVAWARNQEYKLTGMNCMNFSYYVLKAFANCAYNRSVLPNPDFNWVPNGWFNAIQSTEHYSLPSFASSFSAMSRLSGAGKSIKELPLKFNLHARHSAPEWIEADLESRLNKGDIELLHEEYNKPANSDPLPTKLDPQENGKDKNTESNLASNPSYVKRPRSFQGTVGPNETSSVNLKAKAGETISFTIYGRIASSDLNYAECSFALLDQEGGIIDRINMVVTATGEEYNREKFSVDVDESTSYVARFRSDGENTLDFKIKIS